MNNKIDMPSLEERKLRLMRAMWDQQVSQVKQEWREPMWHTYHWSNNPWLLRIFAVILVGVLSFLII